MIEPMIRTLILIAFLFGWTYYAEAYPAEFPTPEHSDDYIVITDLAKLQAYYGRLNNYPHTYLLTITDPTEVVVKILIPDADTGQNDRSVIIVRQEKQGVSEVTRLRAKEAAWEVFFEPWGANRYRQGETYRDTLESGTYLIEVSSPNNTGQYTLMVGEQWSWRGYLTAVREEYQAKHFMGVSAFSLLLSPLLYLPLLLIGMVVLCKYLRIRHHA